jgi:hypothetical protein
LPEALKTPGKEIPAEKPRQVELLTDTKAGPVRTAYDVKPTASGFTFHRHGDGEYHVQVEGGQVTGCSCPDSQHRNGANCKHCREAKRILAEDAGAVGSRSDAEGREFVAGHHVSGTGPKPPTTPTLEKDRAEQRRLIDVQAASLKRKREEREARRKAAREAAAGSAAASFPDPLELMQAYVAREDFSLDDPEWLRLSEAYTRAAEGG